MCGTGGEASLQLGEGCLLMQLMFCPSGRAVEYRGGPSHDSGLLAASEENTASCDIVSRLLVTVLLGRYPGDPVPGEIRDKHVRTTINATGRLSAAERNT